LDFSASLIQIAAGLPTVELPPGSVVIADLHLDCERPSDVARLEALLKSLEDAPVVAILGDLFEYWLGPAQGKMPGSKRMLEALGSFPGKLVFVPGNRDILAGAEFERALGSAILMDGFVGQLGAEGGAAPKRMLFLHGDELCIADTAYLRLRRILRSPWIRLLIRSLPGFVTRALARRLRRHSEHTVQYKKSDGETGQDQDLAHQLARASNSEAVVVGHAHCFRETTFEDGIKWFVLDAFGGERDLMEVDSKSGRIFRSSSLD
jgi:UDP-2,3-diacylglucosamine hydrolase